MVERNWGGNITFSTTPVRPTSDAELAEVVRTAVAEGRSIRAIGSRHSFSAIADAEVMVDLRDMPEIFDVERNPAGDFVHVNAAMTFGRFAELAKPEGIALFNMASLPHISIAGAVVTGTHGSGSRNRTLASAVVGFEVVTGAGDVTWYEGEEMLNEGAVSLGGLGVITRLALGVEPAFEVEQRVFDHFPWDALATNFDEIFNAAFSVSAFTRWGAGDDEDDAVSQLWLKRRTDEPDRSDRIRQLGGVDATEPRHPIRDQPAHTCTPQLGEPGLWSDRLPHFRQDFTPSVGEEIQSEFFLDRRDAAAGIAAMRSVAHRLGEALVVAEIRTIAADRIAMSPCFGRDTVAFHFTWVPDQAQADDAAAIVLVALADLTPRPHWGKVFPVMDGLLDQFTEAELFLDQVSPPFTNQWWADNLGTRR